MSSPIVYNPRALDAHRNRNRAQELAEFRATLDSNGDAFNAACSRVAAFCQSHVMELCVGGGLGILSAIVLIWGSAA